jgi:DNA-binding NtrC family response regulator
VTVSTVLIVQSDPELKDVWALTLEVSGHTVLAAEATADGITRVREGGIDVIVVDSQGGEGALIRFVAELERLPDSPPFVLVSDSPGAPEVSARIGAAAFLPKPCDNDELADAVGRIASAQLRSVRVHIEDEPTQPRMRSALLGE